MAGGEFLCTCWPVRRSARICSRTGTDWNTLPSPVFARIGIVGPRFVLLAVAGGGDATPYLDSFPCHQGGANLSFADRICSNGSRNVYGLLPRRKARLVRLPADCRAAIATRGVVQRTANRTLAASRSWISHSGFDVPRLDGRRKQAAT